MPATELTLAAFAAAGLGASPHCALMCGCLQALQLRPAAEGAALRQRLMLLHAGRVAGYALMGALVGAGGLLLFRQLPDAVTGLRLQGLAAAILLLMGLRQWRGGAHCRAAGRPPAPAPTAARVFLRGMAWALLPCGALYGMLFLAMLSRSPLYAALLMAAFGLGTLPLLGAGGWLLPRTALQREGLRRAGAAMLIVFGLAGLAAAGLAPVAAPSFCMPLPHG